MGKGGAAGKQEKIRRARGYTSPQGVKNDPGLDPSRTRKSHCGNVWDFSEAGKTIASLRINVALCRREPRVQQETRAVGHLLGERAYGETNLFY